MSTAPPLARLFGGSPDLGDDADGYDPEFVDGVVSWLGKLFGPGRYLPVEVRGWENLPESQVFIVSNHSGGTVIPDVWGFAWAWVQHFGHERRINPMAHDMVFAERHMARAFARIGVVRAGQARARRLLDAGRDVMVCPGGDRDTWRRWSDRYTVHFAGRKGYAKLALEQGIPVTPVVNVGAHETLVVLTDGHRVAKRLGLHRLTRSSIWPVHLSLPWMIGFGPLPHIPWPVTLQYRIGAQVPFPAGWTAGQEPTQEHIDAYDLAVRGHMQAMLDDMRRERDPLTEAIAGLRRVAGRARHRRDVAEQDPLAA